MQKGYMKNATLYRTRYGIRLTVDGKKLYPYIQ